MDRGWYVRFGVVVIAVAAAWCALWPSLDQWIPAPQYIKDTFPGRISPGLDIEGGLRLVYEVEVDKAIENRRDRLAESMLERLGAELDIVEDDEAPTQEQLDEIRERVTVQRVDERRIRVKFDKASDTKALSRAFLKDRFPSLREVSRQGDKQVTLALREDQLDNLKETAVEQTVETISRRIDELQIRETTVIGRPQTSDIIVEIPGADEEMFDHIRSIISRTARLEFKIVDDDASTDFFSDVSDLPEGVSKEQGVEGQGQKQVMTTYLRSTGKNARQKLQDFVDSLEVPEDHQLLIGREQQQAGDDDEEAWRTYYVLRRTDVTGEHIEEAFVTFEQEGGGQPVVAVHFDNEGATLFEEMTGRHVKERMAIVLDGRVESAPVIQTKIGGGRAQITLGSYRGPNQLMEEANQLVIVLRAGALPAPIRPSNEQLIGPTLGKDSVEKGAKGALVGVFLVLLFMGFYYGRHGGTVSDLMVVFNLLFLMAVMAGFEATLTLPGVAAIALTVGMAVDANVLIIERIREELRLGKSPRSAVDQGFRRAFWSIFDSQLTTFIAGIVLFQFGTGPIKGFAVMLMIGIVTSLFTGLFCSKVIFDWFTRRLKVQRLRVG